MYVIQFSLDGEEWETLTFQRRLENHFDAIMEAKRLTEKWGYRGYEYRAIPIESRLDKEHVIIFT